MFVTSSSAPEFGSSTSTGRPGFSLDIGWGIYTNLDMLARGLMVTSPSELDNVQGILLTEFHMPEILSMWPVKKEFASAGHIFVISCLSEIPVSISDLQTAQAIPQPTCRPACVLFNTVNK